MRCGSVKGDRLWEMLSHQASKLSLSINSGTTRGVARWDMRPAATPEVFTSPHLVHQFIV